MRSRGGETGGLTIMDALRLYEARGYRSQFGTRQGGHIKCFTCGKLSDPERVEMDSIRRIEGVSDPADEALVAALSCPHCETRGTMTLMYGTMAAPEDNEALRRMKDARVAMQHGEWHGPGWHDEPPESSGAGPAGPHDRSPRGGP